MYPIRIYGVEIVEGGTIDIVVMFLSTDHRLQPRAFVGDTQSAMAVLWDGEHWRADGELVPPFVEELLADYAEDYGIEL